MRILVTGAGGFIGGHLVERLLQDGHDVVAVARNAGENQARLDWHALDLSNWGWSSELPSSIDAVCHLAQSPRYRDFPDGTQDMVRVNIDSTAELLVWSLKRNVNRFLFASSGNVYGRNEGILDETSACYPDSMYSATKLAAEHLVTQFESSLEIGIFRLFGIYGPGQENGLIPTIVQKLKQHDDIVLAGGVGLVFMPLHVFDCVRAMSAWLSAKEPWRPSSHFFNLAGEERVELPDMASSLAGLLGVTPRFKTVDGSPTRLVVDGSRLRSMLDFKQKLGIEDGLKTLPLKRGQA